MRQLGGFVAVVLSVGAALAGCGNHYEIDVAEVTATRGADNRVTVNVTVSCSLIGFDSCSYTDCVEVAWASSYLVDDPNILDVGDGGAVVDHVQACRAESLKEAQTDSFTLISDVAIPTGLQLRVMSFGKDSTDPTGEGKTEASP